MPDQHEHESFRPPPESGYDPEAALRLGRSYPIEGEDLIISIEAAEGRNEIERAIREVLAYEEGLFFGSDFYDLEQPEVLLELQDRFTSGEGTIERPSTPIYLDATIKKKTERPVREIKQRAREGGRALSEEEGEEIDWRVSLKNHRAGRQTIDKACIQRMQACEVADVSAELLSRAPDGRLAVKPDKVHWQSALAGEFGEKVDKVMRHIVGVAVPEDILADAKLSSEEKASVNRMRKEVPEAIYALGFKDQVIFKKWLSYLLKVADGKMDVVWAAWRLALLWELPIEFGSKMVFDKREDREVLKIADPPIANDLFVWASHLEDKRSIEWVDRFITHTGFPLSLGRMERKRSPCQSYLHEAKVQDPDIEKRRRKEARQQSTTVNLWKLWWERGLKLGGDFKNDKKNIVPWQSTEDQPEGLDTDELPPGSFGLWRLRQRRALLVIADIRSRPSLKDLNDPDFFASRKRNWQKVFGGIDDSVNCEDSPRFWWVAGLILAHHPGDPKRIPLAQTNPEFVYRALSYGELWSTDRGGEDNKSISVFEILNSAYVCGFLRKKDIDKLINDLGIEGSRDSQLYES